MQNTDRNADSSDNPQREPRPSRPPAYIPRPPALQFPQPAGGPTTIPRLTPGNPVRFPPPATAPLSIEAQQARLNTVVATIFTRRDSYRAYLLEWYDDAYKTIRDFTPQIDAFHHASTAMAQRRPAPHTTTTNTFPYNANTPAPSPPQSPPAGPRDTRCPAHVCATILPELAPYRTADDSDIRSRGELAAFVLEHVAAFSTDAAEEWSFGGINANMETLAKRVQAFGGQVRVGDAFVMGWAVEMVEQLGALERRAVRFLEETRSGDMEEGAVGALRRLRGVLGAIKKLPGAVRRGDCVGRIVLPEDWVDEGHPAAMMIWRATVRGSRGWRQMTDTWAAARSRRTLHAKLLAMENARMRDGILRKLGITEPNGFLPRAHRMYRAFNVNRFGGAIGFALDRTVKQHVFMERQWNASVLLGRLHMTRDAGKQGSDDLKDVFARSMEGIESQMGDMEVYHRGLSFMQRRALRNAVERHDLAAAIQLLRRYRPANNFSHETTRRQMLHHFGVFFLWSKATTLHQHFNSENGYRIPRLRRYEEITLVRLFCYGAHYFRASQKDNHDMGCLITALSWMCGLMQSWFSSLPELERMDRERLLKKVELHDSRLGGSASREASDVLAAELNEVNDKVKRLMHTVNNLTHATDVFLGMPPSVDSEMNEPAFEKFARNEHDELVGFRYVEMRRHVSMPEGRGVLQGGTMKVAESSVEHWV